jgi:predicted TIM-barrel fold metal-dependent hydrolase
MTNAGFTIDPTRLGLPSAAQFAAYRIWDSYYFPRTKASPGALADDVAADMRELAPFGIERFCAYLHVGLGTLAASGAPSPAEDRAQILRLLADRRDRVLGVIHLNANNVAGSLAALDLWVKDGPVVGVCFKSSKPGCLVCTHPNFDPIVERCGELGVMIMQHTWFKAGGKDDPGESTPAELAQLARRHPGVTFVGAHAGGDWERGLRAVRDCPNVLVETSGFNPTSGFIDMAVRELGAERIVFGGHFMTRSVGTELGKILGADITDAQRRLILGENLRRLLSRVMRA